MPSLNAKVSEKREVTGIFVPWNPERMGKQSAKVGWITDERGCDIWNGSRTPHGYGMVWVASRMCLVHRVRYEREIGPIPEGADLDHFICDNGAGGCCNPRHCRPASRRENTLRGNGITSTCAAKTHCPEGHPLSGDNLDKSQLARGWRQCRTCQNARDFANRDARNARRRATYRVIAEALTREQVGDV